MEKTGCNQTEVGHETLKINRSCSELVTIDSPTASS